jgi:SAM-dependent methyltransferase
VGDNLRNQRAGGAERFVPAEMAGTLTAAEHWARYLLAARLAPGRDVLDAGCGSGYGTALLARAGARRVLGVDIAPEAVTEARAVAPPNAGVVTGDLTALDVPDASFDLVVCFEVLEHLEAQDALLDELRRVVRPDGLVLVSSPNRDVYLPGNPHHVRELVPGELAALLEARFAHVELLRQHPWTASLILGDAAGASADPTEALDAGAATCAALSPGEETYTIGVASQHPLPELPAQLVAGRSEELRDLAEERDRLAAQLAERQETIAAQVARGDALHEQLLRTGDALDLARRERDQARREREHEHGLRTTAEGTLDDVVGSASWRLTAPLRRAKQRLGR